LDEADNTFLYNTFVNKPSLKGAIYATVVKVVNKTSRTIRKTVGDMNDPVTQTQYGPDVFTASGTGSSIGSLPQIYDPMSTHDGEFRKNKHCNVNDLILKSNSMNSTDEYSNFCNPNCNDRLYQARLNISMRKNKKKVVKLPQIQRKYVHDYNLYTTT